MNAELVSLESGEDPFTLVYDTLACTIQDCHEIKRLVKKGNIVTFKTNDPLRNPPQKGNLPELVIGTTGNVSGNLKANTSSAQVTRHYEFMVTTGSYLLTKYAQPVEFAIFACAVNWCAYLGGLKWKEKGFVKTVKFVDSTTGLSDSRLNRGITGWTSVSTIAVDMYFSLNDLKELSHARA